MSYSHQAPYYLGNSVTGGSGSASAASDAGTDTTTSSGVPVDDDGGMVLTLSASTISANDLGEFQSLGSLTRTVSPSASPTPSIAGETAATPSVDIETLLQNEFENLTIREKTRALASVRKFKHPSSAASSEGDTEILTKKLAAKTADKSDTGEAGHVQDKIKPGLVDWQALCKAVSVTEDKMPVSVGQCKKTLKGYNANLYDVSVALRNGTVAQTFPSIATLSHYSKREGKIMSKATAKKDPLLKLMLRELFSGDKAKGKNCNAAK